VPGKAGPMGMHRGGGATTGRWGQLRMIVFRWWGGYVDLWGPQQLHGGERSGEGVAPIGVGWRGSTAHRSRRGGDVGFKTGREGRGVRCSRGLTSSQRGSGCEGARAQVKGVEKSGMRHQRCLQFGGRAGEE
jgi:hypothetical protein